MTRASVMTALAGVLITLAVVGGFLALDRTVLHLYYNDDAAKPASDVAKIAATPTETQPPAPTETEVPAPMTPSPRAMRSWWQRWIGRCPSPRGLRLR